MQVQTFILGADFSSRGHRSRGLEAKREPLSIGLKVTLDPATGARVQLMSQTKKPFLHQPYRGTAVSPQMLTESYSHTEKCSWTQPFPRGRWSPLLPGATLGWAALPLTECRPGGALLRPAAAPSPWHWRYESPRPAPCSPTLF